MQAKIIYSALYGRNPKGISTLYVEQCNFRRDNEIAFFDSTSKPSKDLYFTVAVWIVKPKKTA